MFHICQRFCSFVFAIGISFIALAQTDLPIDRKATPETIHLYHNLKKLLAKGIMFGHQDDLAYGVGWKYETGRSDIKDVTGEYPAVYGWELGRIELDHTENLDGVPFDKMKQFIHDGYERGGVITISWHLNNPLTGKSAWEPATGTVTAVLPGGEKQALYKKWLDKVAAFLNSLKGNKGEFIPVIFRPFHELNGNWFWWGKAHCTPEELKKLYQFTVSYLRDEKQVHHLLYAYNTDRFANTEDYLERYPGNDWVDVTGFDIYQRGKDNAGFIKDISRMLSELESVAKERNKIPALTEFGYGTVPDSAWWTSTFIKGLEGHHVSYALAWRNAGSKSATETEFYVPFKGHASAPNFIKLFQSGKILFQNKIAKEHVYLE